MFDKPAGILVAHGRPSGSWVAMVRAPHRPFSNNRTARGGLAVPGELFVLYLPEGGNVAILSRDVRRSYRVFDPRTGEGLSEGRFADTQPAQAMSGPGSDPRGLVFCSM